MFRLRRWALTSLQDFSNVFPRYALIISSFDFPLLTTDRICCCICTRSILLWVCLQQRKLLVKQLCSDSPLSSALFYVFLFKNKNKKFSWYAISPMLPLILSCSPTPCFICYVPMALSSFNWLFSWVSITCYYSTMAWCAVIAYSGSSEWLGRCAVPFSAIVSMEKTSPDTSTGLCSLLC